MKIIFSTVLQTLLLLVLFTGCGLDNYDEPKSKLTGKVVYNGEAIQVRGTGERVRLQLYQDGFQKYEAIEVFVGQDGSFSAMLFNGDYKMVTRNNNGPWVNSRDTTYFTVKGNTVQDMEVTPYYTITNADMKVAGDKVTATFNINQIVQDREIDRIILLTNKTQFVDDERKVQRVDFTGDDIQKGAVTYSFDLDDESKKQKFLYGRICVWTSGADQGVYSPVFSLK
ncbi:DUF3823 domain-containing protein [Bacteroides sp. 519]|uniref:DUF3823 domain-containing protein n=1 Tax=Bacteroides sp. 519 TaxID=2302937 RepID=UPI0013D21E9C|nr:DUF3823 domain-containing protein [Bacteroides sp. 519]NDV58147.1 DUF3823 domain-containing protein [Bacteroides sp. 519]